MIFHGIAETDLLERIAGARRRIVLHAALYSNFAASAPMREALGTVLHRASTSAGFQGLHAICLDASLARHQPGDPANQWADDFFAMLRPGAPHSQLLQELAGSDAFMVRLAAEHRGLVYRYITRLRPCAPILIIDDVILCGHYLHSTVMTPQGVWFRMEAPVEYLFSCAANGTPPEDHSLAAPYRFVEECRNAMRGTLRVRHEARNPQVTPSASQPTPQMRHAV